MTSDIVNTVVAFAMFGMLLVRNYG